MNRLCFGLSSKKVTKDSNQTNYLFFERWNEERLSIKIRDRYTYKHWYYLGAAILMYSNWLICTVIGLTVGHLMPNAANYGLDFAMSVTFIGMVIPYLKNKPMVVTVICSGIMALLTQNLPYQSGLIVAASVGIMAGMFAQKINR